MFKCNRNRNLSERRANFILIFAVVFVGLSMTMSQVIAQTAIITCQELQNMKNDLAGNYYLADDINCSGFDYGDGKGFMPIGDETTSFTGNFDGKDHKITNLTINRPATDYVGLFGITGSGSEVKDVGLENVNISGNADVGGLAGWNNGGAISNTYSTGSVSGSVGSTGDHTGGLVGVNDGTISNSYSTSSVSSVSAAQGYVGGLVGSNAALSTGTISNSYSTGSVTGDNDYIGGLVGCNGAAMQTATITNSYSTSSVSGNNKVGGLVGHNYFLYMGAATITYSYSTGSVTGTSNFGGLVGDNNGGTVSDSYWDTETSGQASSDGGTGKTTAEMKTQATFGGWNFTDTWSIDEGVTYPYLQCFATTTAYGSFKVWLEGAYNTAIDEMRIDIHGSIPLSSPYTAAPATVTSVPADVVDWVWVQLRSTESGATEAQRSLFLKKDGNVVDTDGTTTGIPFEVAAGDYYVIVRHRNHLGIMSATKLTFVSSGGTNVYNFTTASSQSYGTDAVKELETGVYGMYSGEGNNSGIVSIADVTIAIDNRDAVGYETSDYNLSNIVSVADATNSIANRDKTCKIPSQ